CLSASATREDLTLIAVIMGAESSKIRFSEASRLLDYGFANYEAVKVAEKGQNMGRAFVERGIPETVEAVTEEEISVLVPKGQGTAVTPQVILNEGLKAPLEKGTVVGELKVYQGETLLGTWPLTAAEPVEQAGWLEMVRRMIHKFF
ncbi:MAG: D-alanyl-D-alanine carboxypeptidase, partial [Firmicutes bacterium]|nr:D-alanyl-D-alanine carboxypeptidase [Bacillota bacterium]